MNLIQMVEALRNSPLKRPMPPMPLPPPTRDERDPALNDRELLLVALDVIEETQARCVRIETRLSKLLVHLGMNYNGTAVPGLPSGDPL